MRKENITYILLLFILLSANINAQTQYTLSGFVKDEKTGEFLIGAYAYDSISGKVESTNTNGYFSILVSKESCLTFSYVGYVKMKKTFILKKDSIINIGLKADNELKEINVKAYKRQEFNTSRMSIKELESIPSLGGKPDVIKAMQLLPGIQSQNEASSLLIVRGGDPGQNLYLLDNTPLIYVNHLGGFMSVFNPDMINDISILKGGFPPEYGGKLSSVVNITQRKGDASQRRGSFGLGITDINATIEGPLGKKGTYIFTARKTLFDLLMIAASGLSEGNDFVVNYGFHDINGKLTWQLNKKNKLWINIYQGDDYLGIRNKILNIGGPKFQTNTIWGNWMLACHLNTVINPKLFVENSLSFTRYRLREKQKISGSLDLELKDKFTASVDDFSFLNKWNYTIKSWLKVKYGFNSSYLRHTPYRYVNDESFENKREVRVHSFLNALFLNSELKLTKNIRVQLGVRAVNYSTENFSDNSLEPRIGLKYSLSENIHANLSYMKVKQYSHLLFTTGNIASNEVWIPSNNEIAPAIAEQYSAGLQTHLFNNQWNIEFAGYYKSMNQLSTYKSGEINLKGDENWIAKIETGGQGTSYGFEFQLKKNYGKWTGNLSYTWSKTDRQYPGINNGESYIFDFDRTHALSAFINLAINDKWDFNAVWTYQTGLPYTPAIGRHYTTNLYLTEETNERHYYEALIYGEKNGDRMKAFHCLDLGFNYTTKSKRGNKVIWSFSLYNAYNRQNPNFVYYNAYEGADTHHPEDPESGFKPLDLYQISLFPIIPSVSYKVFFDGTKKERNPIKNRLKNLLYYD